MISWDVFRAYSLEKKIDTLYNHGNFIVSIRYYGYKVNLYQLHEDFIEVFINHKYSEIERIEKLDIQHSRMKFYCDQIKLCL